MDKDCLKERNVFWFLIDGLSPNNLYSCGNTNVKRNFFDELIEQGVVFTNVASTAAGTHTSMHSIFSSLMPSVNGATGWVREALRGFKPEIFTLTDLFKYRGYNTFRYCDADGERTVPMSGFDVWESSGYTIGEFMKNTDMTQTPRRKRFIEFVKKSDSPKFVYHHVELLHELNGQLGSSWGSKEYEENIAIVADEFKKLYGEYEIKNNDILILSSDHGVILNNNWMADGSDHGERHYEQSVRTFFAMITQGIEICRLDQLISSLDIAPTLSELILDFNMPGQGISRSNMIGGGEYTPRMIFREKGTYCTENVELRNPLTSDVFYVRDDQWKYVYGLNDERCEWLINLEKDGDYNVNLKDREPELVKKYRDILQNKLIFPTEQLETIYKRNGFELSKKRIKPFFSVVINAALCDQKVYESLMDLAGPYYELIILGKSEHNNGINVRYVDKNISELKQNDLKGDYTVVLDCSKEYSEYLLSDLYTLICNNKEPKVYVFGSGLCRKSSEWKNKMKGTYVNIRDLDGISNLSKKGKCLRTGNIILRKIKVALGIY